MKKLLIIISIILIFFTIDKNVNADVIIPEEAIRFRVLANSNNVYDQEVKLDVSMKVQEEIFSLLEEKNNIEDARNTLKNNLDKIENVVERVFKEKNYIQTFKVSYGNNYFPEKQYKGVTYNEGEYESLLITLGKGEGDNWWCVLFPPLCLIEAEESDEVEYKFFVKELIDKYF